MFLDAEDRVIRRALLWNDQRTEAQCREISEKVGDVLLRRSMVGLGPRVGLDVDEAAAQVAVWHLGWSQERADREVEEFRDYVRRMRPKEFRKREPART